MILTLYLFLSVLLGAGVIFLLWWLCFRKQSRSTIRNVSIKSRAAELLVFKEYYSDLQWAIQSPGVFACNLYSKGIIDEDVRDRAQLLSITSVERNQILLSAVEQAIKTDPQHFQQFLGILADEPTTESLYRRLLESYNTGKRSGITRDCSPYEQQQQQQQQQLPSTSKETQTVMPFPQRLQVSVPIHCATVKAVNNMEHSDGPEKIPHDGDEWLTLSVSILDSSSGMPLSCVVALQGDQLTPTNGHIICYLSLTVDAVEDNESRRNIPQSRNSKSTHFIQRCRRSKYIPNGKAFFRLCFFQPDVNYIISFSIHSVYDEEGLECIGYTVEHYTGFISAVHTVERNAFKAPPLLKYEGPIASKKFDKLMSLYMNLFYQGKSKESNTIMSRISSSDSVKPDIKLYMSMSRATEKPFDSQTIPLLEELFQRSQSLDNQNGFLLQGLAMLCLSQTHSFQGRTEKALDCLRYSRSICFEVAPSHLTSCVFLNHARMMIGIHKGNISPSIKRRIYELFDRAIADSYYGVGWERLMVFQSHLFKALFCLNGVMDISIISVPNYIPTEEDISLAEQHLNAAPLELVSKIHMYKVLYHTALSDLNRWRENIESAREHAEVAKQLCVEKGFFAKLIPSLEDRLQKLEPDVIEEILETYKDHV